MGLQKEVEPKTLNEEEIVMQRNKFGGLVTWRKRLFRFMRGLEGGTWLALAVSFSPAEEDGGEAVSGSGADRYYSKGVWHRRNRWGHTKARKPIFPRLLPIVMNAARQGMILSQHCIWIGIQMESVRKRNRKMERVKLCGQTNRCRRRNCDQIFGIYPFLTSSQISHMLFS